MGKNYIVSKNKWCPLSDIMDSDYDHTKNYTVYVNAGSVGILKYLYTAETPTSDMYGKELPSHTEISVTADTADNVYFKNTANPINVYIEEL